MSKKTKSLDKYVVAAMIYIVAWSVAFFISWIVFQNEPSVLEGCILSPGVAELVCCAWIKQKKPEEKPTDDDGIEWEDMNSDG